MSLGASDKDKLIRIGVISAAVLVVGIYGYLQLHTPDAPPPLVMPVTASAPARIGPAAAGGAVAVAAPAGVVARPASVAGPGATKVGTTASQYDPTLRMEAMLVTESLRYAGAGRNIFSDTSAPLLAAIPKPIAPIRTNLPIAPAYTAPAGPPPPPPIDLKFFGTETRADGSRQAFLLHGDDVFLASTGTIVQRRYKVGTISTGSIEIEDLTSNNKQSLPLQK